MSLVWLCHAFVLFFVDLILLSTRGSYPSPPPPPPPLLRPGRSSHTGFVTGNVYIYICIYRLRHKIREMDIYLTLIRYPIDNGGKNLNLPVQYTRQLEGLSAMHHLHWGLGSLGHWHWHSIPFDRCCPGEIHRVSSPISPSREAKE